MRATSIAIIPAIISHGCTEAATKDPAIHSPTATIDSAIAGKRNLSALLSNAFKSANTRCATLEISGPVSFSPV